MFKYQLSDLVELARGLNEDAFAANYASAFLLHRPGDFCGVTTETQRIKFERTPTPGPIVVHGKEDLTLIVLPIHKEHDSPFKQGVSIGRTRSTDICVPYSEISKLHGYFVENAFVGAGSRNGSSVNGDEVLAGEPVPLADGDVLTLGPHAFAYFTNRRFFQLLAEHR